MLILYYLLLYYFLHIVFFFNAPATTEIYTLSLHDALPIWRRPAWLPPLRSCSGSGRRSGAGTASRSARRTRPLPLHEDRKSTRLNSSHITISYAVFCLKKKKKKKEQKQKKKKKTKNINNKQ